VLIVDDDRDFTCSLVDILETRGYHVEIAHSVQGGREKAETFDAQVALLDIRLGRNSGIDLIPHLKEARPGILCVMMTAYAAMDSAIEAIHGGAYDYLQKPLNIQHLLATLDRCFEKLQLEHEKAATEKALRESEVKHRLLLSSIQSPILALDREMTILYCNDAYAKFAGKPIAELAGRNLTALFPDFEHNKLYDAYMQALETGETHQVEDRFTNRYLHARIYPTPWGILTIAEDVTERVQAENAIRQRNRELALLNRVGQELAATFDLQQITDQALRQVIETIGAEGASVWLQDEEQEGGLVCWASLSTDQYRSSTNLRLGPGQGVAGWAVQTGESVIVPSAPDDPRFFRGVDELTGFRTTSLLAVPLQVRGAVIGVLEVVNKLSGDFDAQDLILVEALAASTAIAIDNARLVEVLQARNEELDAFAHTVAHDLKGPLGYIVGFAQALEEEYDALPGEEVRRHLRTIAKSGHKMSNIIDELLVLATVRKMEDVQVGPLYMDRIVADVRERLARMIEEHQAEIVTPESWPVTLGYGPWIEEVWVNYINNAIKYGGEPPRIQLGATEQPDGKVRFWVRDNGPGLKPEEQARLYRPFVRLDKVRAKGYGLGLSIVERIVKRLGGKVGVDSEAGAGSVFWFVLPKQPHDE
jgi:PAS domain S-box-containing protein